MKTIVAFGIFDIMHPGHIAYLKAASKLGDRLIVVVGRDEIARKEKGTRPVMSEQDRLQVVSALRCVDHAVLGDRGEGYQVLLRIKPDILAIGYDQNAQHPVLKSLKNKGLRPKIVRMKKFGMRRHASSRIKSRIPSL